MSESNSTSGEHGSEATYKIGAVSRLTHIPAPTLRMWERRYTVVVAQRTAKQARLYSKGDVTRLALIKQLVDLGNAISTLANLSLEQLREVKASYDGSSRDLQSAPAQPRAILVGDELTDRLRRSPSIMRMLSVVAQMRSLESLRARALDLHADVVIFDMESIDEEIIERIMTCVGHVGARNAIVVFSHAKERVLERASPTLSLIRRPVNVATLIRLCLAPAIDPGIGKAEWLRERLRVGMPSKKIDDTSLGGACGG
jgi:DNA-binding transcriptional MerR regulator